MFDDESEIGLVAEGMLILLRDILEFIKYSVGYRQLWFSWFLGCCRCLTCVKVKSRAAFILTILKLKFTHIRTTS